MKSTISFLMVFMIFAVSYGQPVERLEAQQGSSDRIYTLSGFRHGVNFFPKVRLSHVQYEAGETLDFSLYHSADVIYTWLERWAEKYPSIVDLYEVGRSFEGRPIFQITVTNKES
ncbi:MAG TPA: M14 family zinc carboxypeptidase, partial [Bacteroidales bacterium]|nr:M14 family zinc carboxypeptidase [Bacteroidales bacterium]